MNDDAIAFRIHAAVMAQFNRYWSPAGWLTRAEWLAFQGGLDDFALDLDAGEESNGEKVDCSLGNTTSNVTAR